MTYYINRKMYGLRDQTCDEYETHTDAYIAMCKYQVTDHGRAYYYLSTTPKENWND